jgi:hypothetical protein
LEDPSEANEDNPSEVRWETSRHSRNKKREYLKDKINEHESDSKNKNVRDLYRGINEFKEGYQNRINLVKDERGDLLADPHKIFVRQNEIHTPEPLVPESSASEIEVATGKLKRYKSPGVDQIPAELIQTGGETLH